MLIPDGLDIGAPVMAAGAVAFTAVGIEFDHPGTENVGNMPAKTDAGASTYGKTRILTDFRQAGRDINVFESFKAVFSTAIPSSERPWGALIYQKRLQSLSQCSSV